MSAVLFTESAGICSPVDWDAVTQWAKPLSRAMYPDLRKFVDFGFASNESLVARQLYKALADSAPSQPKALEAASLLLGELRSTPGPVLVNFNWDEEKHKRDHGKFATVAVNAGAVNIAPDLGLNPNNFQPASIGMKRLAKIGAKALSLTGHAEHVVTSEVMKRFRKLPSVIQAPTAGFFKLTFATYLAAQAAAKAVAKARGGEEHADRVAKVCTAFDAAGAKLTPLALEEGGYSAIAALGASFIPVGSMTYLAYTGTVATVQAARKALAAAKGKLTARFDATPDDHAIESLLTAFRQSESPDWFEALLCVAADETNDLHTAIDWAKYAQMGAVPPISFSADKTGHEHKGKGKGGGQFVSKGQGGGEGASPPAADPRHGNPQEVRDKFTGSKVGKEEHVHAAGVEQEVAKFLGGKWEEDNKPYDVQKGDHFVEVKSMLKGRKTAISVHDDALIRKVDFHAANPGSTFHTVVVDERSHFGGGQYAGNYSGQRLYYRRGSGRYGLASMYKVKNAAELRRLLTMSDEELPEQARGSLPSGPEVDVLRVKAKEAHAKRLAKDMARKRRLRAERQL